MDIFKINEVTKYKFLQTPWDLFNNKCYRCKLNSDAKLVYSLLLDRMHLSAKNNWCDEEGRIYLLFTKEHIADKLGITPRTVYKAFNALEECELISQKRQGLNRPNMIFIGKFNSNFINKSEKCSGCEKYSYPNVKYIHTNQTYKSHTYILNGATEDSSKLFFYFIEAYKAYRKEEHPIVNGKELKRVLKQLEEYTYEDEIQMIDKYFNTELECDYRIWNYLSDRVRELRMYETIY